MRSTGHPQIVFTVEVWAQVGRLPLEEFRLIRAAIGAAAAETRAAQGAALRQTLRAGGHVIDCLFEPGVGLFTVEHLRRE